MALRASVVMPVHNSGRFIAAAIGSLLASTLRDFELLVIDDASTDDSMAAARRASADDPRVRIIPVERGGVAAARNAGLHAATGEYIANLDSDDVIFPDRLARQVAWLDRHPEHVALGVRSVNMNATGRPLSIGGRYFTHDAIDDAHLQGTGGALGNNGAMFRRTAATAIGGYDARLSTTGEDHDLWLRLAEVGRLACLGDVLMWYRIHDANVSLGEGSKERRLPVTLATLARTFARRGLVGRVPTKLPQAPPPRWLRWCDRALMQYFRGERRGALATIGVALALAPASPVTRAALRTILAGPSPRPFGAETNAPAATSTPRPDTRPSAHV